MGVDGKGRKERVWRSMRPGGKTTTVVRKREREREESQRRREEEKQEDASEGERERECKSSPRSLASGTKLSTKEQDTTSNRGSPFPGTGRSMKSCSVMRG